MDTSTDSAASTHGTTRFPPGKILLAIDGESHTVTAVDWAIRLSGAMQTGLVALHVADPYLKQFADELYAQGRQAYRKHVECCLDQIAEDAVAAFERATKGCAVECEVKIRHGALVEELLAELAEGNYGLLVLGKQRLAGVRRRLARNLSQQVASSMPGVPILVVPEVE